MDGGLYMDGNRNYYVDCHQEVKDSGESVVYRLSPCNEPDGEPCTMVKCNIVITNPTTEREKRMKGYKFKYMLLSRMQQDCEYYNTAEHYNNSHTSTTVELIQEMKNIWNEFPSDLKPEWISMEDILEYERKFTESEKTSNNK